jgi:hypothetical protein
MRAAALGADRFHADDGALALSIAQGENGVGRCQEHGVASAARQELHLLVGLAAVGLEGQWPNVAEPLFLAACGGRAPRGEQEQYHGEGDRDESDELRVHDLFSLGCWWRADDECRQLA